MGKTQRIVGVVLVALALALAGYAWVLSQRMAAQRQEALSQLQPVVVAAARIPAGSTITPEMVRVAMFPARPDGSYTDLKAVEGKVTASDIAAGEPLLLERLETSMRPMLQHLEPGERAVAVRVDEVVAVGNRLNPGDMVDVYVTLRRNQEEIPDSQARRLLEKLKVLAFGAKDTAGGGKATGDNALSSSRTTPEAPKTAVLAVKVEDVDKLALAADTGRLLLALRPREPQPAESGAVATGAKEAEAGKTAVAAMLPPPSPPEVMTLRELVDRRQESAANTGVAGRGTNKSAGGRPAGQTVTVMHGLKEKTIYLSLKKNEARP